MKSIMYVNVTIKSTCHLVREREENTHSPKELQTLQTNIRIRRKDLINTNHTNGHIVPLSWLQDFAFFNFLEI